MVVGWAGWVDPYMTLYDTADAAQGASSAHSGKSMIYCDTVCVGFGNGVTFA